MNELPEVLGIAFQKRSMGVLEATFERIAQSGFQALLLALPDEWELEFYDQFYPSLSDPGAYVTIQRHGTTYAYRMGNHGWSTKWTIQSRDLLAAWMRLNLRRAHKHSTPLRSVKLRRVMQSAWTEKGLNKT